MSPQTLPHPPLGRPIRHWCIGAAMIAFAGTMSGLTAAPAHAAFPGRNGRIVYVNTIWHGDDGENQIYTIRANGTGQRRLTFRGNNDNPEWAPFGHRIVYLHTPGHGRSGIWVMGANGRHKHPLVPGGRRDYDSAPAWSPDGSRIAFIPGTARRPRSATASMWRSG
jgi:dipeptidyl aminopeptidase/acylaminoacyl peptidase